MKYIINRKYISMKKEQKYEKSKFLKELSEPKQFSPMKKKG